MDRADVYALIDAERAEQRATWGGAHDWGTGDCSKDGVTPELKAVVLFEEAGEVARAVFERDTGNYPLETGSPATLAGPWQGCES